MLENKKLINMKQFFFSLLTVGVLLATAATTAAQTKDHSFTLGVGLTAHNDNIGWAITNSYNLGVGVLGVDIIYPFSSNKEDGASIFTRAGLKFNTGLVTIEPDLVASFEGNYRFGIGLGSEYFLVGSFGVFVRGFLTYALHPQESGVTWDNMKAALMAGIVINI